MPRPTNSNDKALPGTHDAHDDAPPPAPLNSSGLGLPRAEAKTGGDNLASDLRPGSCSTVDASKTTGPAKAADNEPKLKKVDEIWDDDHSGCIAVIWKRAGEVGCAEITSKVLREILQQFSLVLDGSFASLQELHSYRRILGRFKTRHPEHEKLLRPFIWRLRYEFCPYDPSLIGDDEESEDDGIDPTMRNLVDEDDLVGKQVPVKPLLMDLSDVEAKTGRKALTSNPQPAMSSTDTVSKPPLTPDNDLSGGELQLQGFPEQETNTAPSSQPTALSQLQGFPDREKNTVLSSQPTVNKEVPIKPLLMNPYLSRTPLNLEQLSPKEE
ncbi:hypothetical protein I7I48_11461 [Histoplasma ohiense]|nr:hypothetical protein I7I48_11461 [Histoplasma ohiense (nom. inval.)]